MSASTTTLTRQGLGPAVRQIHIHTHTQEHRCGTERELKIMYKGKTHLLVPPWGPTHTHNEHSALSAPKRESASRPAPFAGWDAKGFLTPIVVRWDVHPPHAEDRGTGLDRGQTPPYARGHAAPCPQLAWWPFCPGPVSLMAVASVQWQPLLL